MARVFKQGLIDAAIRSGGIPGIGTYWKHRKGGIYKVTGYCVIEESRKFALCYEEVSEIDQNLPPIPWVRTLDSWRETVPGENGETLRFTMIPIVR